MSLETDRYRIDGCMVRVDYDSGGSVGGECGVVIEGEGWSLERTFYFGEANDRHIRRFVEKAVRDLEYRKMCLAGVVAWARLSQVYEEKSLIAYSKLVRAHLMRYTGGDRAGERRYRETISSFERLAKDFYGALGIRIKKGAEYGDLVEEFMKATDNLVVAATTATGRSARASGV